MVSIKLMTGVSVVLVLQATLVLTVSLGMYKSCMYECLHCVNTWGKDLFNGGLCAEKCALSGGRSIDKTCASFFTRSSRRASASKQLLHSFQSPSRPRFQLSFSKGYSNGYLGYRGYRTSSLVSSAARLSLASDCQRLCKSCESRFTVNMDAHNCRYTCIKTKRRVISC